MLLLTGDTVHARSVTFGVGIIVGSSAIHLIRYVYTVHLSYIRPYTYAYTYTFMYTYKNMYACISHIFFSVPRKATGTFVSSKGRRGYCL